MGPVLSWLDYKACITELIADLVESRYMPSRPFPNNFPTSSVHKAMRLIIACHYEERMEWPAHPKRPPSPSVAIEYTPPVLHHTIFFHLSLLNFLTPSARSPVRSNPDGFSLRGLWCGSWQLSVAPHSPDRSGVPPTSQGTSRHLVVEAPIKPVSPSA